MRCSLQVLSIPCVLHIQHRLGSSTVVGYGSHKLLTVVIRNFNTVLHNWMVFHYVTTLGDAEQQWSHRVANRAIQRCRSLLSTGHGLCQTVRPECWQQVWRSSRPSWLTGLTSIIREWENDELNRSFTEQLLWCLPARLPVASARHGSSPTFPRDNLRLALQLGSDVSFGRVIPSQWYISSYSITALQTSLPSVHFTDKRPMSHCDVGLHRKSRPCVLAFAAPFGCTNLFRTIAAIDQNEFNCFVGPHRRSLFFCPCLLQQFISNERRRNRLKQSFGT